MNLSFWVEEEALDELDAAIARYDAGGQLTGQRFKARYDKVIDRIIMWPESGAVYEFDDEPTEWDSEPDFQIRWAKISGFPYRVVYLLEPERLTVIAVVNERRRPGYWRERVPNHQ